MTLVVTPATEKAADDSAQSRLREVACARSVRQLPRARAELRLAEVCEGRCHERDHGQGTPPGGHPDCPRRQGGKVPGATYKGVTQWNACRYVSRYGDK